jgi:hypothetical protein
MLRKTGVFLLSISIAFFWLGGLAGAQHQHGHGTPAAPAGKMPATKEIPVSISAAKSVTVEGFKITFEVMSMGEHMKHLKATPGHAEGDHAKTHSFMVTLQDTASKEIISDAKIQYLLSTPGGDKETGNLTWSGDHYGGGFSPKDKGTYQVQLKIESSGMERGAKFTYEFK